MWKILFVVWHTEILPERIHNPLQYKCSLENVNYEKGYWEIHPVRISCSMRSSSPALLMFFADWYYWWELPFSWWESIVAVLDCQGLFRIILGLFYIEKQGLAMWLGKKGGSVAALLKNHPIFLSSNPLIWHFWAQSRQTSATRLFRWGVMHEYRHLGSNLWHDRCDHCQEKVAILYHSDRLCSRKDCGFW